MTRALGALLALLLLFGPAAAQAAEGARIDITGGRKDKTYRAALQRFAA